MGQVLTAAQQNILSGDLASLKGAIDSASKTASTNISGTTEGTATTIISGNSITYDGTEVRVEFYCPEMASATSAVTFVFTKDGTALGQHAMQPSLTIPVNLVIYDTPSAGAHTYAVKAFNVTPTSIASAGAGGAGAIAPVTLRMRAS